MYNKMINQYLKEHKNNYKAKYVYHSCDCINENCFKFHYYIRERQLLQMNVFMTIQFDDEIKVSVNKDIHEHEQFAIACDALEKIQRYINRDTTIPAIQLSRIVSTKEINENVTAQDMINIFNHIMFHNKKNPDSIYQFYELYIPYLKDRVNRAEYNQVLLAINYLLECILSEKIWQGFNIKYLDQEYIMHSAYFATILNILYDKFELFDSKDHQLLKEIIYKIIGYWRFAFALYAPLENLSGKYPVIMKQILLEMELDKNHYSFNENRFVYNVLYSIVENDEKTHRQSIIELLKLLLSDILSLANPEEQKETGLHFLMMSGFDLLLEIFDETKDCYIYLCFSPKEIPADFHPYIKKQLEDGLKYYINEMRTKNNRYEAIDQISKINALLIEYFSD